MKRIQSLFLLPAVLLLSGCEADTAEKGTFYTFTDSLGWGQ